MAIAKIIYKENASATPEVWMDTTQKTVTSGSMLSGTTALKNDGTGITGNIASKSSSNLTASGATVTAPAGYYASDASKSVASGTAGTPTATKGTVSNNSVSVTPSVTNTTGYITGGTKTGTAVTVSASELVSGTKAISASGTTDVTNYASASVAAGSATTPATSITANPTMTSVVSSGKNLFDMSCLRLTVGRRAAETTQGRYAEYLKNTEWIPVSRFTAHTKPIRSTRFPCHRTLRLRNQATV